MIAQATGRRTLLALVGVGFFAALAALALKSSGGAISGPVVRTVITKLLKLYVPLLALLGSFYFSQRRMPRRASVETSAESFLLAATLTATWCFLAPILIITCATVEGAIRILDSFEILGSTLAVAALGYYFSKSAQDLT